MINNTVIEVLDREHGKKVIEWFKGQGVDTECKRGNCNKRDRYNSRFYGVVEGCFYNYTEAQVSKSGETTSYTHIIPVDISNLPYLE